MLSPRAWGQACSGAVRRQGFPRRASMGHGESHGRRSGGGARGRVVLPEGRFLHRPLATGGQGVHHPWPRRSRAAWAWALPRTRGQCPCFAHPPGGRSPFADRALWRARTAQRRAHLAASGGPCAGLGPGTLWSMAVACGWRRTITSWRPMAPARRSSLSAVTPSSRSPPSGCPSTAGPRRRNSGRRSTTGGAPTQPCAVPRCCFATRSARRSVFCTALMPASARCSCMAQWSRSRLPIAPPGCACRPRGPLPMRRWTPLRAKLPWCWLPPRPRGTPWIRRFPRHADAFASGWMQLRGTRRRRGVDRGSVLSDQCRLAGPTAGDCRDRG